MNVDGGEQAYPMINVEEFLGKTVGRRESRRPGNAQETGRAIYRRSGFKVCDSGVFRFSSHEEANEWMMQMAIKRAHRAARS